MVTFLNRLQDWFLPDTVRRDRDLRRRAAAFVWSNLFGPPTGLVLLGFLYVYDPDPGSWYFYACGTVLLFLLFPLALKFTARFELLAFAAAQLFGLIILAMVCLLGGVHSPVLPWFVAVVMTGCLYFGNRPRLRDIFIATVAAELATVYGLAMAQVPLPPIVPPRLLDGFSVISDFMLVVFITNLALHFVAIVAGQQRGLEGEVAVRRAAEARLTAALDQAEQAMRSKATFLANTSHELRTPLNAIIGFADVIRAETFGPIGNARYREYLGDIAVSGQHLLRIINDILDLSKFEAGKAVLDNEEPIDPHHLIDAVRRMIQPQADAGQIDLDIAIAADLPRIFGNDRMLHQVLLNLVSNAVKFTPPGGTVTVGAARGDDDGITIRVRDTGIGMTESEVEVALTPFGQVDSELGRRFNGTGLGLPLTKAMIELHQGRLVLNSVPGQGTEAIMSLPPERVREVAEAA